MSLAARCFLLSLFFVLCFLGTRLGLAAEDSANDTKGSNVATVEVSEKKAMSPGNDGEIQKLLDSPNGISGMEYGANGGILRLRVKGEAEVTGALKAARAERLARDKAQRDAKAAFAKFLNEEVSVQENDEEETIVVEKDGKEQAGYKSVSTQKKEIKAREFLRGLIVLVDRIDGEGDNRKATVVFGWSKKLADATRNIQKNMAKSPADPTASADKNADRKVSGASDTKTKVAGNISDF